MGHTSGAIHVWLLSLSVQFSGLVCVVARVGFSLLALPRRAVQAFLQMTVTAHMALASVPAHTCSSSSTRSVLLSRAAEFSGLCRRHDSFRASLGWATPWVFLDLVITEEAQTVLHMCINSPGCDIAEHRQPLCILVGLGRGATPNTTSVSSPQIWADPGKYALMGAAAQLGESCLPCGQPKVRRGGSLMELKGRVLNLVSSTTPYRV